jgi:hypothetical protein
MGLLSAIVQLNQLKGADDMEAIIISGKQENLNWDYDEKTDVLCISTGNRKKLLASISGEVRL